MTPKLTNELQDAVKRHDGGPVEVDGDELSCVLMSVDVYRSLIGGLLDDDQDYAECVDGIRRGLGSMARDEGIPLDDAFETIRKKHDIPVISRSVIRFL